MPLEFPNGELRDVSGHYKISRINENEYDLRRKESYEWKLQYKFSITPRKFADYEDMCEYQQTFPGSIFRNRMICAIATQTGRVTLSNSSQTVTEGGTKTKTELKHKEEFYHLLNKYFQIKLV